MPTMRAPQAKRAPEEMFLPWLETKILDETAGTFEGYLAVKNNVDMGNDRVKDGAFGKTIQSWQARFAQSKWMPYLWQHDPSEPIGGFTELREDPRGLYVKGFFDLDIEEGRRAYSGFKKGYLSGLSMGYEAIKKAFDGSVRDLLEVKLWEGSAATFPMNTEAEVTQVKTETGTKGGDPVPIDDPNAEAGEVAVLQQALKLLADCIALVPKCLGNQATCDQCNAMIAQVMVLVGQAIAAEAADAAEAGGGDTAEDFDLYDRLEAIWRAVKPLGTIQDGDWSYPRFSVVCPRVASVVIEDQETDQNYQVPYTVGPDGAVILGEMQPVDIAYLPAQKARARRFDSKAGRRNSTTDKQKITNIFEAATGLMDPDHTTTSLKSLFGSLSKTQRADLLSALQSDEPDATPKSAPGPAAAGAHPDEGKGAHSAAGAAGDPEIARMALETLALLQKAAAPPTPAADPEAEAMALLTKAATNLVK